MSSGGRMQKDYTRQAPFSPPLSWGHTPGSRSSVFHGSIVRGSCGHLPRSAAQSAGL